jgi:hypothetical protein
LLSEEEEFGEEYGDEDKGEWEPLLLVLERAVLLRAWDLDLVFVEEVVVGFVEDVL